MLQLDKLTRLIAWVFDDIEFIACAVSIFHPYNALVDTTGINLNPEYDVEAGVECQPATTDLGPPFSSEHDNKFGWSRTFLRRQKYSFHTPSQEDFQGYMLDEDTGVGSWNVPESAPGATATSGTITAAPFPLTEELFEVPFDDWTIQAIGSPAQADYIGEQDFFHEWEANTGSAVLDERGDVVNAPLFSLTPFRRGTGPVKYAFKAHTLSGAALCLLDYDGPFDPPPIWEPRIFDVAPPGPGPEDIPLGHQWAQINAPNQRETIHMITVSFSSFRVFARDSWWRVIGWAPGDINSGTIQLLFEPEE